MLDAIEPGASARRVRVSALTITALAATAVTVKLSGLVFALGVAAVVGYLLLRKGRAQPASLTRLLLPGLLIVPVGGFRGFLLAGVPLYPSMLSYFPVEWAVPPGSIIEETCWAFSWARCPEME